MSLKTRLEPRSPALQKLVDCDDLREVLALLERSREGRRHSKVWVNGGTIWDCPSDCLRCALDEALEDKP